MSKRRKFCGEMIKWYLGFIPGSDEEICKSWTVYDATCIYIYLNISLYVCRKDLLSAGNQGGVLYIEEQWHTE